MDTFLGKASSIARQIGKFVLSFMVITAIAAAYFVISSGDSSFQFDLDGEVINDVTGLNPVRVTKILIPESVREISEAISESTGPISIGGGKFSQGGQTAYEDSLHIDMRGFDQVLSFSAEQKQITVQPGITWHEIQEYIDPHNLSVRIMQTYSNFTVGGSMSVNVHGRYIGEGPLVNSIISFKVVLADGEVATASPSENSELFYGAIGGYGGLGVIVEATLSLVDNTRVERVVKAMAVSEYGSYFAKNIRNNPDVVFHNADIYPPDYKNALDVSWYKTDKSLTKDERIIPLDENYYWGPKIVEVVANYDAGKWIREYVIDPIYYSEERVVWRNWEASYDVRELEPHDRSEKTYVLREYFVPVEKFDEFVPVMSEIFRKNDANIINVSVRHAHNDPGTLLAWATVESFAFVVYYQQGTDEEAREAVRKWSVEMIDAAIAVGGTYYLPYQILASQEQFLAAYPRSPEYFALKTKLDPKYRFRNQLWKQHYPLESHLGIEKDKIDNYYRGEEQTFLTIPEWYLVFNPLEYAQFLEAGENPSDFPFFSSINQFWVLYDRVKAITDGVYAENTEYVTMLQVIGISTTVEYMMKGAYENSVGRFTRWTAGGEDTQEDLIITQAQRAYSNLIFYEAWYEFDFSSWQDRIWSETDFFGDNFIRKLERKLFFSLEYQFKAFYAKLIKYGAQTAYEQSDGLVYMEAIKPQASTSNFPSAVQIIGDSGGDILMSVPRWGAFTKAVTELAKLNIRYKNISGNRRIVVSMLSDSANENPLVKSNMVFSSLLVSNTNKKRTYSLVAVQDLSAAIAEASNKGFQVEHIFDY